MVLAFRLFGNFAWPPAPKIKDTKDRRQGSVEILFADKNGEPKAFMRWVPKGREAEAYAPPTAASPSAYDNNIVAHEWFADEKNACQPIWIDGPATKDLKTRAVFRGAHLLLQEGEGALPSLTLPLVPECQVGDETLFSGLTIKESQYKPKPPLPPQPPHPRFDLDLNLFLPAARTATDASAVFPLSVIYYPEENLVPIGRVGMLVARRAQDKRRLFDFYPDTAFRSLGQFGFAANGSGADDFAVLYGGASSPGSSDYFPKLNTVAADVLAELNLKLGSKPAAKTPTTIEDAHLRFAGKADRGSPSTLIYRVAFRGANLTLDGVRKVQGGVACGTWLGLDVALSWDDIAEEARHDPTSFAFDVTVRLVWQEEVSKPDFDVAKPETLTFGRRLLVETARRASLTRKALPYVEGAQPVSLLPELGWPITTGAPSTKKVFFTLHTAYAPKVDRDASGLVTWDMGPAPRFRLTLADPAELASPEAALARKRNVLPLRAELPGFARTDVGSGKATGLDVELAHDRSWPPRSVDDIEDGEPYFASFALAASLHPDQENAKPQAWTGRIGSLQFQGRGDLSPGEDADVLRTAGWGFGRTHAKVYPACLSASLRLSLSVARVTPVSADVARSDRSGRPPPLLIDLAATKEASNETRFVLRATETFADDRDRLLTASLFDSAQGGTTRDYVLLGEEPFSILRFAQVPLGALGDAGTTEVAVYSSDDRIWQYRLTAQHYHYVLPPQAIGESADKPRRLELHDPEEWDSEKVLAPYADEGEVAGTDDDTLRAARDLRRRAVAFRLTPSTEIWIRPSDVARGYFMPEQASYDIFRQRGEYGLGAALAGLRGEFLYGLTVGIDPSKEHGIARHARVAEIGALTGSVVGYARETHADHDVSGRWNALASAIRRRPERLEIWARDPDSPIDFTPARFSDGVTFALRDSALHRAPLPEPTLDGERAPPVGGGSGKPTFHPHGLSGGALWPIESLNLLRILREDSISDGGTIENVALSPFGGDAAQKAQFLRGKVAILSETRGGFVERHKVEVIGRIGALWHRAKHVVVYERTTSPSAQFAPRKAEDPRRTRSRRPILRKVREYIELIEPERAYPDFPQAVTRSAGFLQRVRFNSRIINVDSAWSREVDDSAWCVPLWNRRSARERPQVYPMPDIAFVTAAEGDGEAPVVSQECLDPDQLWFFADFAAETSDTDQWRARLGIDFANLPLAQAIATIVDEPSNRRPDDVDGSEGRRPAVTRILPGARRFTWRVAPAARKTAINAGRSTKPVYVGLDSVSFMRAAFDRAAAPTFGPLRDLLGATQGVSSVAAGKAWGPGAGSSGTPADFDAAIVRLRQAASAGSQQGVRDAVTDLAALKQGIEDGINEVAVKVAPGLAGLKDALGKVALGALPKRCDQLKADAVGTVQRKALLVRTVLQEWQQDAVRFLDTPHSIGTKRDAIDVLCDQAALALAPIFDEASQDVGRIGDAIEIARGILQAVEWDVEELFAEALRRIERVDASYERDKPWSPERRRALSAALRACLDGVGEDFGSAILEARQRLTAEIDELGQGMAGQLGRLLDGIASVQEDALRQVGLLDAFLESLLRPLVELLDRLAPAEAGQQGLLDKVAASVATFRAEVAEDETLDKPPNLKDGVLKALDGLGALLQRAEADVASIRSIVGTRDVAFEALEELVDRVGQIATDLVGAADAALDEVGRQATALADATFDDLAKRLSELWGPLAGEWDKLIDWVDDGLEEVAEAAADMDVFVADLKKRAEVAGRRVQDEVRKLHGQIDGLAADAVAVARDLSALLAPANLLRPIVIDKGVRPALEAALAPIPEDLTADFDRTRAEIQERLQELAERVGATLEGVKDDVLAGAAAISELCGQLKGGVDDARKIIDGLIGSAGTYIQGELDEARKYLPNALTPLPDDLAALLPKIEAFDRAVRGLHNDVLKAGETARMYGDRVLDAVGNLGKGGVLAAPSNILKAWSAVSSAPELAGLRSDIDRIRSGFDELSDIIDTTEAGALFNRLGDELKAMGLSIPFDKIGDGLLPANLADLDIGKVFRNFGGAKLDKLFRGYKLPAGVRDAIRISHDFDGKQGKAWVQVDIDAPMPGRRSLFAIGPFSCDFLDMRLTGQVRLDASKDSERVTLTGYGRLGTTLDMVVSGQSMVRFEKFALNFSKENGLAVEFDPKNIRLNSAFEFVQEALAGIFPDAIGPLKILKEKNVPIGVEHEYALPVISLNAATSGISNISIENRFRLIAFPDFVIADRFGLCRPERPFIFSIFILGGCGYIQIEAEYRPFDSELTVTVDASAGASALLGFSVGPFSGQVFIALSAVLSYRKTLGRPGGGLSVSCTLVIAGNVDVMGIVSVGIYLLLRMTYRDTGEIDADGTLSVTIRISRFFKIKARAQVTYRLRNGRGQVQSSASVDTETQDKEAAKGIAAAKKLGKAVG